MAEPVIIAPYIPQTITVHLGPPNRDAENVTVSFPEYVKNSASSEIYPTWGESALQANILAITSFALNRVYTEHYRSRGKDFDITNSTAYDQAFTKGRSSFEPISELVNLLFNSYIRRIGFIEPLAAKFCNGTTSTCSGLSQWGSEALSKEGYSYLEILKYYYGDDIEIVSDVPVRGNAPSYPGYPLSEGSTGSYVTVVQTSLNRIAQNYPAIPKIVPVDGIYGKNTTASVKAFQEIFSLKADGIVGSDTWYQIVRIYVAVVKLAELQSEGQTEYVIGPYPRTLKPGDTGDSVAQLQYMLDVAGSFIPAVPKVKQDGIYGQATQDAVRSYQQYMGLPATGIVDPRTWDSLYEQLIGVDNTVFQQSVLFPGESSTRMQQYPGKTLRPGATDGGSAQ